MEAGMSPKVPQSYLKARRAEIIEAAIRCFSEKGFRNTTMQDIYDKTNLSPGAVYHYFVNKEDIVAAALESFSQWSISELSTFIAEHPGESIARFFHFWLSTIQQSTDSQTTSVQLDFYAEATRNPRLREILQKMQNSIHQKLLEIIHNSQEAGQIKSDLDALAIARIFMSIVFGISIHRTIDPQVDIPALGKVCDAILDGTFAKVQPKRRPGIRG